MKTYIRALAGLWLLAFVWSEGGGGKWMVAAGAAICRQHVQEFHAGEELTNEILKIFSLSSIMFCFHLHQLYAWGKGGRPAILLH